MVALGNVQASQVLAHLSEEQVARLTWLVAHTEQLNREEREEVLRDFYASLSSRDYASVGGPETAQRLLEEAFGSERAAEIQSKLGSIGRPKPFKFLERVPTDTLADFLSAEHPQMIALVLMHLDVDYGAALLTLLPAELQADTLVRVVSLDAPAPEAIELTEAIIQRRLAGALGPGAEAMALQGTEQLIEVLRHVDVASQRVILDGISGINPELAAELGRRMLTFEDLALLDDRSLQLVIREIDPGDLTFALRAADDELRELMFANMSSRAATMAREDMETVGPVRLTVIHEAQNRIVTVVRRLQESEEIIISRPGEDELVA